MSINVSQSSNLRLRCRRLKHEDLRGKKLFCGKR